MPIMYIM